MAFYSVVDTYIACTPLRSLQLMSAIVSMR